jgi:hypothetical protein
VLRWEQAGERLLRSHQRDGRPPRRGRRPHRQLQQRRRHPWTGRRRPSAYSPPDPHTTSLCVGDGTPGATRPTVTITREADAIRCRAAVSGERIVTAGRVDVEGRADAGRRGAFWWSVEPGSRVQRTAVGLAQDGTLLLAVVSATRDGQRNGMTLDAAARWLIRQGAVDAISLDGGHQAEAYVSGRGPIVPLQAGEPRVQVSLLLGRTVPVTAPPPPPPAPPPPPPAPALPPPPAPVGPGPATASGGDGTASRTSAVSSGVDGTDGTVARPQRRDRLVAHRLRPGRPWSRTPALSSCRPSRGGRR